MPHRATIPQWTVEHGQGIGRTTAVFEAEESAVRFAVGEAYTDNNGSILTMPDGEQYLVIKLRRGVDIVAQRTIRGG